MSAVANLLLKGLIVVLIVQHFVLDLGLGSKV